MTLAELDLYDRAGCRTGSDAREVLAVRRPDLGRAIACVSRREEHAQPGEVCCGLRESDSTSSARCVVVELHRQ